MKTAFSKISTLNTVFEKLRFHNQKLRLRVNERPKRINEYAFSKISVYVWTGPKSQIRDIAKEGGVPRPFQEI